MEEMKPLGDFFSPRVMVAADALDRSIEQIKAVWEELRVSFAAPLAETITPMLKDVIGWVKEHGPELVRMAENIAHSVAGAIDFAERAGSTAARTFQGLEKISPLNFGQIFNGTVGGVVSMAGEALGYPRGGHPNFSGEQAARRFDFNLKIEDNRAAGEAWRMAQEEFKRRSGQYSADYDQMMIERNR